jgi:small subunit ribosomal protein S17
MEKQTKTMVGEVVSDKMTKTVIVAVEKIKRHPLYGKAIKHYVMYKAHDANGECKMGDTVRVIESRPISREIRWRVREIIAKGEVVQVKPADIEPEIKTVEAPKEIQPEEKAA